MNATQTAHSTTATAKREVREALKFAGFAVTKISASKTHVNVTLTDEAAVPAVLRMYPDATAPYADFTSSYHRRTILISR